MSARIAVVDTNVVVAALIGSRADSPVASVLDSMLGARFPHALSEALLAEYRTVLARPKLARLHRLAFDEIESLLLTVARHAIVLEPVTGPPAPDPGDMVVDDPDSELHEIEDDIDADDGVDDEAE